MSWFERWRRGGERPASRLRQVGGALLGDLRGNPGAIDLDERSTVVLCCGGELPALERAGPLWVVAATAPTEALPDHQLVRWDAPRLLETLRAAEASCVVVVGLSEARLRPLRAALHHADRVVLVYAPGLSVEASPTAALALAGSRRVEAALGRVPALQQGAARWGWRLGSATPTWRSTAAAARAIAQTPAGAEPPRLDVLHHISSLGPGGAERQLTYQAGAQRRAGQRVAVVTGLPCVGADAHYVGHLRRAGVQVEALTPLPPWRSLPPAWPAEVRVAIDAHVGRGQLAALVDRFRSARPGVVHAWLDEPNLIGGLAALAAGVPRVVLSARSVNPTHYPDRYQAWFPEAYLALAAQPRVALTANSRAVGDDYADWLGLPRERFDVVPNALPLDVWSPLDDSARRAGRAALGIDPDAFLVVGVFRLSAEKRPTDFVEALAAARARLPRLRAIHVGGGPLRAQVEALAQARGLAETLQFLGRREDPRALLGLGDVSLLTSAVEGSPNVSLESQALGVPILLTRTFGSPETLIEGETGFCFEVGDCGAMAARLVELAASPARVRALGGAGRSFVEASFSVEAAARRWSEIYGFTA